MLAADAVTVVEALVVLAMDAVPLVTAQFAKAKLVLGDAVIDKPQPALEGAYPEVGLTVPCELLAVATVIA